ncbi:MAG: hypothetical protein KDJ38_04775 [Gammaproteobacteria bacterium]|nr:hypothetical protein [Gammaproteobacteria bacterium]
MLSLVDCLGLCDLTEEEILSIAEHEHIPDVIAAEMGDYLVHSPDGVPMIKRIILDDIEAAVQNGQEEHAQQLRRVLKHFIATHPEFTPEEREPA